MRIMNYISSRRRTVSPAGKSKQTPDVYADSPPEENDRSGNSDVVVLLLPGKENRDLASPREGSKEFDMQKSAGEEPGKISDINFGRNAVQVLPHFFRVPGTNGRKRKEMRVGEAKTEVGKLNTSMSGGGGGRGREQSERPTEESSEVRKASERHPLRSPIRKEIKKIFLNRSLLTVFRFRTFND